VPRHWLLNNKGSQINNLKIKIKDLETGVSQNMSQIDDLGDEIGDLINQLKDVQGQRESVQRQYNGLAQSLLAAQEEQVNNRASWEQKEADSAKGIDRLKSDQILARGS